MALSVLVPLPFVIISTILRFWIRTKRKAWGPDDWAMLINLPVWTVATVSTLGMAWSGVGQYDGSLTASQYSMSLKWFYVFQEPWCFTLVAIKCSIGFALIRIANRKKWIEMVIYACMISCFVVMGGTGMYLFFQCRPVQKNWYPTMDGECNGRNIQTVLSYAVAVVSISTDWIFATLPIFLLWDVQLDWRVKISVMSMLGLGIFASIAPIVRLKFLIGLNDPTRLLQNLGEILAWACAEMNVGMFVANLPACRPLLTNFISHFSSWSGSHSNPSGGYSKKQNPRGSIRAGPGSKQWMELNERPENHSHSGSKPKSVGVETKIYGDLDEYSNTSLEHVDGDQKRGGQRPSGDGLQVSVQKDFRVEISDRKQLTALPRVPLETV
ncbi:hypothetical protein J4E90_007156 [Alternaria incomplexa]|uniref:uncharacterized protein n=1 Tax=Alternaria incomplexa TaxID=1187928 RepID=UPI00221FFCC8|nr:uncharacterized protein J4E90_007156 [Alternaria incomplexa]KAI4910899.1 hypothetical protein J4E90_007156 [Alternaria incomplexa]